MNLSILVAFRDTDGNRTKLWRFIRERLEARLPDAEIVVGTDDGQNPFHKTLALNRAAAQASRDIFMLTDADTWLSEASVAEAVQGLKEREEWWRPWRWKAKLCEADTEWVLQMGEAWDGTIDEAQRQRVEARNSYWAAAPILMTRSMWDRVGGMDERFVGWGHEDDAFAASLWAFYGRSRVNQDTCIHLFHPRIGRSGLDLWPGQDSAMENRMLGNRYRASKHSPKAMERLIAERELISTGGHK